MCDWVDPDLRTRSTSRLWRNKEALTDFNAAKHSCDSRKSACVVHRLEIGTVDRILAGAGLSTITRSLRKTASCRL